MQFDWWTLGLQTVNFAVLVWLLHRFLYRPVLRVVDARRAEIERRYAELAAADRATAARREAIDRERAGMAQEREAMRKSASAEAEAAAAKQRAEAERQAAALVAEGRKTVADERAAALSEAKKVAVDLGAEVARRLIAELPMAQRAEAWLERMERHIAALPKAELAALRASSGDGAVVTVVTASPLPPEMAESWRARLGRALGANVVLGFEVDPELIAGAELHLPNLVLRASWRTALAALRSEIEAADEARR